MRDSVYQNVERFLRAKSVRQEPKNSLLLLMFPWKGRRVELYIPMWRFGRDAFFQL